jgi:methionyl-tRNA synthetase
LNDKLGIWLKEASVKGFWANNALKMTESWIRNGLQERAITRDLKWGIPVPKPGYENKVFYVWFDACIGYISITGNLGAETTGDWHRFVEDWWKNPEEVELFQFIGKDNIPFHTVIFPSSLLGTGDKWTMLHHMSSTEYLNYEGGKFSKTRGVGIFGTDAMETGIPADVWRFYIFYNRPEKADALFTWKDFQEKVNGELIGNLGNLVNRTLSFVTRYYGGVVPGAGLPLSPELAIFRETVKKMEGDITDKLERSELRDAFRMVFELSSFANKKFQDAEPWRKRTEDPPAAELLIRELCFVVRDLALLIEPFMPAAARQIASFFGLSIGRQDAFGGKIHLDGPEPTARPALPAEVLPDLSWADLGRDDGLPSRVKSEVLFAKLEDELVATLRERFSGSQKERAAELSAAALSAASGTAAAAPGAPSASGAAAPSEAPVAVPAGFGDTLDLRVAQIVKIERHPKADKLYIETLEIGDGVSGTPGVLGTPEERIIVSGLVPFYKEEELLNKRIIVAYNLKPAKLRGVESRGMLLAASFKREDGSEQVEVLDAGDAPTGTRVELEGAGPGNPPAEINIDAFFTVPLLVRDYTVESGGKALTLLGKPIRTQAIATGEVH